MAVLLRALERLHLNTHSRPVSTHAGVGLVKGCDGFAANILK
jgi:hypothetical protein